MGGPFYVVEATVMFTIDPERVGEVQKLFRDKLGSEFEIYDAGFSVKDAEAEHGFRDIGYGYAPFDEDGDPPGAKRIMFGYDSPVSGEGREERVAAALNEAIPGIDAKAECWGETW